MTTLKIGQEIHACVQIEKMASFWQNNRYNGCRELQYYISLPAVDGCTYYVTSTGAKTKFGQWASENQGAEIPIVGKFKKMQDYQGNKKITITHVTRI